MWRGERQTFHFARELATLSAMSDEAASLNEEALPLARKLNRAAVETVLRAYYPRVFRISAALCGTTDDGRQVARLVMQQSLKTLPWWSNETEAGNWFLHHTVLMSRERSPESPDSSKDCLIVTPKNPSPDHVAFVKALRKLPQQHREAFLLFRGEHLDPRQAAVAMDCSTGAAATHRIGAEKTLSEITADTFDARTAELMRVYASLTPPENLIADDVSGVASELTVRKQSKSIRTIILLVMLAIVAWAIWQLSKMVDI
jgi:DNA-directed RNA polymerase specialized sigma24 family protein